MRYSLVFSHVRTWWARKSAILSSSVTPSPVTSMAFLLHLSNALEVFSLLGVGNDEGEEGPGVLLDPELGLGVELSAISCGGLA